MRTFLLSGAVALAILLGACSGARSGKETAGDAPRQTLLLVDTSITAGQLPNGLKYYIRVNRKPENRAELRLAVNAGSILEDEDQQGLAHFVEHMAFNGTEHFAKQELIDYLESVGMRFGPDLNAYTSFDETVYMLQIPTDSSEILETAFRILQEWAYRVSFDPEEIDKERGVVIEEWRLGRGADARMRDKQFPILFKDSRYARRLPIGQKAVLDSFHHETLRRFYRDWYRPDLMAVVAVGDFDKSHIENLIKTHFSGVPSPPALRKREIYPVPGHSQPLFSVAADPEASGSRVSVYYKRNPREEGSEAAYRRSLVEALYNAMFNQRLDELRRQPEPPFLFAFSGQGRFVRSAEVYVLSAGVKENQVASGLETLLAEAERVRRFGFTASELQRQKIEMLRSMEQAYQERDKTESRVYAAEYIRNFLTAEPIPGLEYEYQLYQKFIPGIALEEVNRLSGELLTDHNRVVLATMPEKEGVAVPTEAELQAVFRKAAGATITPYVDQVSEAPLIPVSPLPGKIVAEKQLEAIGLSEWTLSNGLRVILKATDFQNDEVIFSAYSPGGNSLLPERDYIAAVTATAIVSQGGVGSFSQIELQKKLAGKVVSVSPGIGALTESLSGSASPQDLETLFQLIHLYFTAPRMDSTAYLSYRSRVKGFLQNRSADPESAFEDTIEVVMAQRHFRSRPWSEELLEEMDLARSFAIYRERFADAGDFTFIFVGNLDTAALRPLTETYLGSLPSLNRRETWKDPGIRPPAGVIRKEVRKGQEDKSEVRMVFTGPFDWSRQNRYDIAALAALLRIKLRETLREDLGGTYGVGVRASPSQYPEPAYEFTISFGCAPERVEELIQTVFRQIDSLKQSGAGEKDLQKIKETQRRQYQIDLKENNHWLRSLQFYYFNGESPLNILDYPQYVEKLDAAAIRKAAQTWLNENNYALFILYPEKL